jgi:hypothetical protein
LAAGFRKSSVRLLPHHWRLLSSRGATRFEMSDRDVPNCAEIIFRNSLAARPGGRCFGQTTTIFHSGFGDRSERYSGKSSRSLRATATT